MNDYKINSKNFMSIEELYEHIDEKKKDLQKTIETHKKEDLEEFIIDRFNELILIEKEKDGEVECYSMFVRNDLCETGKYEVVLRIGGVKMGTKLRGQYFSVDDPDQVKKFYEKMV